jgi:hypothetical protein
MNFAVRIKWQNPIPNPIWMHGRKIARKFRGKRRGRRFQIPAWEGQGEAAVFVQAIVPSDRRSLPAACLGGGGLMGGGVLVDHMGSDEDGKRKRMVRNRGRERRAGRSWPVPPPELLVGLPGVSHLALYF